MWILLVVSGCRIGGGADGPASYPTGSALTEEDPFAWEVKPPIGVKDGFIIIFTALENRSGSGLKLLQVSSATERGFPSVARVVKHEIAVRRIEGGYVDFGRWGSYPPTARDSRRSPCALQDVAPVDGFLLPPHSGATDAAILTWIEGVTPGSFEMRGYRIIYEQEGKRFEQVQPLTIRGRVSRDAPPVAIHPDELECIEELGGTSRRIND